MYRLIINIEKEYTRFTQQDDSDGYCVGFCLKWLGDILNNNKIGYKNGAFFVDRNDREALLNLMNRAKKKHESYVARYRDYKAKVGTPIGQMEFMSKYNDRKQRELEKNSRELGLYYKYFDFMKNKNIVGLERNLDSSSIKKGVMISFSFDCDGQRSAHVVAAIRATPEESYLFDPNCGLYQITSARPEDDIKKLIAKEYKDHRLLTQTVVSQLP